MFLRMNFFVALAAALMLFSHAITTAHVEDQYRWLENDNSLETIHWLSTQRDISNAYFAQAPGRETLATRLREVCAFDVVHAIQQCQDKIFFIGKNPQQQQPALYYTDSMDIPQLVIDPLAICEKGTTSLAGYVVADNSALVAYGISDAGSDWQQWRIKDLHADQEISDCLNGIKFGAPTWDSKSEGLYYIRFSEGGLNALTTTQMLCYHRLGTAQEDDTILCNSEEPGMLFANLHVSSDGRYLLYCKKRGTSPFHTVMCINLNAPQPTAYELLPDNETCYNYIGSSQDRFLFITDDEAPRGRIISVDPLKPGQSDWLEIVPEGQGYLQQALLLKSDKIVLTYLKEACSELIIYDTKTQHCQPIALPGIGTATLMGRHNAPGIAPYFYYSYCDLLHPSTAYRCDIDSGSCTAFMPPKLTWNPEDYIVKRIYYPSTDGQEVPMLIAHHKDSPLDGSHPTLLYGYGGFKIALTPNFGVKTIVWLENGGIFAVANIRGGGEFGEEWHRAGMLHNKQQCFDDFIAGGQWLCNQGYTNHSKLAIQGGSNGGLLVGACLTQRPELFKAAIADVGVLDMLRFHLFTIGWAWTAEYGCADNPQDFDVLYRYSPYHNVKAGTTYPATLITTSDHDNRVVPLHSYKFAAALQEAQGGPSSIILKVYSDAGHGAGKSQDQILEGALDHLSFLFQELMR